MDSKQRLVSIGMPVYNGEKYLEQALDSLLNQDFKDFEVIISDNGSNDKTQSICEEYAKQDDRITYYRSDNNQGAAWNFNQTFTLAKGKYFKWLSHDDYIDPTYLSACVEAMEKAAESVVLCFPQVQYIDKLGRFLNDEEYSTIQQNKQNESYDGLSFSRLLSLSPACCPILVFGLIRTNILRQTGLIGAYVMSDLILVAELRLLGEFIEIPERLFFQRIHEKEISRESRNKVKGEALWYNPKNSSRIFFPILKLIAEYCIAIYRHENTWKKRGIACLAVLRFIFVTLKRYIDSNIWKIWSYLSAIFVRILPITSIPMRIWCLGSGLRGKDKGLLILAFSRPWSNTPKEIFKFAAERLIGHKDKHADAVMTDWLTSKQENCRWAAREAGID